MLAVQKKAWWAGRPAAARGAWHVYYKGESANGLFAAQPVSHAAQGELLQALDRRLSPEAAAAGEGDLGDGSVSLAELEAAAKSVPRGKAPGLDGIPYEFCLLF